jgi:hypothetical protein
MPNRNRFRLGFLYRQGDSQMVLIGMALVAYNLTSQLRQQASFISKCTLRELSFTGVWTVYREYIQSKTITNVEQLPEQFEIVLDLRQNRSCLTSQAAVFLERLMRVHPKRLTFKSANAKKNLLKQTDIR